MKEYSKTQTVIAFILIGIVMLLSVFSVLYTFWGEEIMTKAAVLLSLTSEQKVSEGGFKLNICNTPLNTARKYAENEFSKASMNLDDVLPNFNRNYMAIQVACKKAVNVPRIEMPVIEPADIIKFAKDLSSGSVDILRPYARGHLYTPTGLEDDPNEAKRWIKLGYADNDPNDDRVKAKLGEVVASKLLPSQSQIWLEKVIANIIKFGVPKQGSPVTSATLIVSKEGYILDGHHRYGQAMMGDPSLKMDSLRIPIDIKTLIKVGRTYGNALGNRQKA